MTYPIIYKNQCFFNLRDIVDYISTIDNELSDILNKVYQDTINEMKEDIEAGCEKECENLNEELDCAEKHLTAYINGFDILSDITETLLNYATGKEALNKEAIEDLIMDYKAVKKDIEEEYITIDKV